MGDIIEKYTSQYDVGDVVIFAKGYHKDRRLFLGIIEGYYIDHSCDNSFWYNIKVNSEEVYTYTNKGDIAEYDIIAKVEGELKDNCLKAILKQD